ncbi:MAG: excinuclease ABC subunit UvrC [Candidatus Gastranaerophilales bacterium]|nr:excinuclease ABC subunit UvrC [Candidatus Gastranaerophilales bacterium]
METIAEQLKLLPEKPGSYRFLDKNGTIIYVGKAKNLKKRVSSYFHKKHDTPKLKIMVPQIVKIEFIITNTETEALILESHLIKKYKPKYNVLLKDDKKYPYFLITEEEYPRILIVRKHNINMEKGKYFGPYTDSGAMRSTLELMKKLFPLKQCKSPKFKDRPCIYYDIKKCSAPCQKLISSEDYKKLLSNVELFLSGNRLLLVEELKKEMQYYSDRCEFEKAAKYRDAFFNVKKTIEKQKVVYESTNVNKDVIGITDKGSICAVSLLQIRDGRLTDKKDFELTSGEFNGEEDLSYAFLGEYYSRTNDIPKEIIIPTKNSELKAIANWLSEIKGSKVKITTEITESNEDIVELAKKNSDFFHEKLKLAKMKQISEDYNQVGAYICEKLNLLRFPHRVECYDISHIQGTNTVASMVVFINGLPAKSEYRKYKIKTVENGKPDDFQSMKEVLSRRLKRLNEQNYPDLIIIDGGKGQLSSVLQVVEEQGIKDINFVSLAKREEEIFIPHQSRPVIFPRNSEQLYFFQRIRDEAHRFAITFHRKLREKSSLESVLDGIKGLSEKSKKILRKNFKDVKKISLLTLPDIALLLPPSQALRVYRAFRDKTDNN